MAPPTKSSNQAIRSNSPRPQRSLTESLELALAVNVLEPEPLAMVPPAGGPTGPMWGSPDPKRGRPTSPRVTQRSASASRSLTPRRGIGKSPARAVTPVRPTTGQLALREKAPMATKQAITISSDTIHTSSYSPSTPTFWRNHQVVGGGPGKGKVLIPPLNSKEKMELRESFDSSASPSIRRKMDPPPINGAPGKYEEDPEKGDIEKLLEVTASLRKKNRILEETVSELRMENLELEDHFRHLRISTSAKIKRLAQAIGREDLLKPPSP